VIGSALIGSSLERGKHPWGRMIGIEQAKVGTTRQYLEQPQDEFKTLSHVEVKISGVSSEISKEMTDHLTHLIKGPFFKYNRVFLAWTNFLKIEYLEYVRYAQKFINRKF